MYLPAILAAVLPLLAQAAYVGQWETLPPTPKLPAWNYAATAPINNISLWYANFGCELKRGAPFRNSNLPIIVLHPGLASSRWMGNQIRYLQTQESGYAIIAIDSRGQGRSTDDVSVPITYDLMAKDALGLMDYLSIPKAIVVGWSDGGNIALDMAMMQPSRVDRLMAYGANYIPDNFNASAAATAKTLPIATQRFQAEYEAINPRPNWNLISQRVGDMQSALPQWNGNSFAKIPTPYTVGANGQPVADWPLVWIADGDKEEVIDRDVPTQISDWIPGSGRVIHPQVSHFAAIQDPDFWNAVLDQFLTHRK